MSAYDDAVAVRKLLETMGMSQSSIDLLEVIESVVENAEMTATAATLTIRQAFEFFQHEGVEYDAEVGEVYYSIVREAVTDRMRKEGFLPGGGNDG